jgi:membrane associated rhomboid family serine protease
MSVTIIHDFVHSTYLYQKRMLSITVIIIIITAIISIAAFRSERLMNDLIFYPPAISANNQYYRFLTCGLIHADLGHLLFNMLSLYFFGVLVERSFDYIFDTAGKFIYLAMYILALIVSIYPSYSRHKTDPNYRSLGASGAVSAVVFAGLMIAPQAKVGFFFIPPIIPGFIFGPLYLIISAWLDKRGGDNINHSAHIWGALFGVAFLIVAGEASGRYHAVTEFIRGIENYFSS